MCSQDIVPDDILELILLHLNSPVSLIRAASTCQRWRRIAASSTFLHQFRSLHGLFVFGACINRAYGQVSLNDNVVPSLSTTTIHGRHLSLDFLPGDSCSIMPAIMDSRGSLLLLRRRGRIGEKEKEVIVCEPLTRVYNIIAPPVTLGDYGFIAEAFLLDGENTKAGSSIGMSNYRVAVCFYVGDGITFSGPHVGVFTSGSSWRDISIDGQGEWDHLNSFGLTVDSVYWHAGGRAVLVTDRKTAEFSSFLLPDGYDFEYFLATNDSAMVKMDDCDSKPRIVVSDDAYGRLMFFAAKLQADKDGVEWALERNIQLLEATPALPEFKQGSLCALLLRKGTVLIELELLCSPSEVWTYRLNIETMEVERVNRYEHEMEVHPCEVPWPPNFGGLMQSPC